MSNIINSEKYKNFSDFQKHLIRKIDKYNKYFFNVPRKIGTTYVFSIYALNLIEFNNSNVLYLLSNKRQVEDIINTIKNIFNSSIISFKKNHDKDVILTNLKTQNYIYFTTYLKNFTGYKYDIAIIDGLTHKMTLNQINSFNQISDKIIICSQTPSAYFKNINLLEKNFIFKYYTIEDIKNIKIRDRKEKLQKVFNQTN